MDITKKEYWQKQYQNGTTGWDIGAVSTPIKEYIDQLKDQNLRILIPGAGNAYEASYLFENGFKNVYILDFAEQAMANFRKKHPNFPTNQIITSNFFDFSDTFDLIFEQTFFSALPVYFRQKYVEKVFDLLKNKGKLVGVLFDIDFGNPFPPFGGNATEYKILFEKKFKIKKMEKAYNSIKPRMNNELFVIFEK